MDLCGGEEADPREGNVVRVCSCEFVDRFRLLAELSGRLARYAQ